MINSLLPLYSESTRKLNRWRDLLFLPQLWKANMHANHRLLNMVSLIVVVWCMTGAANAQGARPPAIELFVAPGGNDAADGSEQMPLATLAAARQKIRALKKASGLPEGGVTVFVRGGVFELTDTFHLTAEDSGTQAAPVVYRAYNREKPVLTGARRISGFVPHQGEILKADVAAQGFKDRYFRQLFFNGKRQHLARYPNFDPANPYAGGYAYVDGTLPKLGAMHQDEPNDSDILLHYRATDARTWAQPELGEVNIFPHSLHNWGNCVMPIASVDRAARIIRLTCKGGAAIRPYDRYYVRNLLEELDSPGEWYLDKQTWTLYFWPPEPIKDGTVCAPVTRNLIEILPDASWITLQGFAMEGCDGSAVAVWGSKNCFVAGNTIHNTGGWLGPPAVCIQGGRCCGVVGNDIFDVCDTGISLNGGDMNTLTRGEHYAENNYIHHVGVLKGHGFGISLSGVALRASHNLIHDITRCGVFGGGPDCVVEYNHIRHINLETEDTGGYYNGGMWHIRGQIVRYNFIHDTLGYGRSGDKWVSPFYSWGIYLDDDQSFTHVYGNIIARTASGACFVHAGRNNVIENNIFIENTGPQIQYSGHDPKSPLVVGRLKEFVDIQKNSAYTAKYPDIAATKLDKVWHMADNKIHRNIIYYRNPKANLYGFHHSQGDPLQQNEIDFNFIWHFGLPLTVLGNKPMQWQEWQKEGFDTHSVVADPLFVDPDKDDYRLKPDSPALELGFKPIPVEKIGPYKDELRASWPIVEAEGVREHPLPAEKILLWADTAPVGDGTRETTETAMTVFLPPRERATGAAVVICPGGGYIRHVLNKEGPVVAQWLVDHGIAGIVLEYRMPRGRPFVPLLDAQHAIRVVRSNAEQWNLNPQRIGIMGFSAGGHLASTAGTHFDVGDPKAIDPIDRVSCRPDFMVLVYPVVTMGEKTNGGTKDSLLGPDPKPELIRLFSNEQQITDQTPPTFLAHAKDDVSVPPENSRAFRDALREHRVAVEYLELPSGGHGLFGCKGPMWEAWKKSSLQWMASQGIIPRGDGLIP